MIAEALPDEILGQSEDELEAHFRPSIIDWQLRKRLWELVTNSQLSGTEGVLTQDLFNKICSKEHFYSRVITHPHKLAWLLINPQHLQDQIDEACEYALKRLRYEILTMPINKDTARIILKATELLMNRSMGPMVQKIESKSLNANVSLNESKSREELEQEFTLLQERLQNFQTKVIDVQEESFDALEE